MAKHMGFGLQQFNLSRMLSSTKIDTDQFDLSAHIDKRLSYGENERNIRSIAGITHRNRGMEEYEQREHERKRASARRAERPFWQSGLTNEHLDSLRHALPPGRRVSKTGNVYYERRSNRSDVPGSRI